MPQNSTSPRRLPNAAVKLLGLGAAGAALWLGLQSCSTDAPTPRVVVGHARAIEGVPHGNGTDRAEHYCRVCHGEALSGGPKGEPSCYGCHGKNWLDDASFAHVSSVPADHSVSNVDPVTGYALRHHPEMFSPQTACVSCHGADLQGTTTPSVPGCELCHGKLWVERTPPG